MIKQINKKVLSIKDKTKKGIKKIKGITRKYVPLIERKGSRKYEALRALPFVMSQGKIYTLEELGEKTITVTLSTGKVTGKIKEVFKGFLGLVNKSGNLSVINREPLKGRIVVVEDRPNPTTTERLIVSLKKTHLKVKK